MQVPQIGPYQIVAELGRGGMGVVYEVSDPSLPGRRLALKQILKNLCGPDALRRFAREAEMLAKVQHPNVVRVYACTLDPVAYLVTELVEGQDLQSLCVREQLGPERCAEIVAQLGDAIGALHGAGIIHRDLKPENAIMRPDGTPVLLDFGLARELDGEGLTRTGEVLGTPAYMSPEQADAAKDIDERTDVYGLGAILFQLLAGRAPFQAESMVKLLYKVLQEEPNWAALREREVPKPLIAITQRALEKERDLRYPSAQALSADLRRYLAGEAIMAQPRGGGGGKWIALGGLLALGLAGAGAALWVRGAGGGPSPTPTPTPTARAERPKATVRDPLDRVPTSAAFQALGPAQRFALVERYLSKLDATKRELALRNLRDKPVWRAQVADKLGAGVSAGNLERGALFLPEGQVLSWFGGSDSLVCVAAETGEVLWRFKVEEHKLNAVALCPDAQSVLVFESPHRARRVHRAPGGWASRPERSEPYRVDVSGLEFEGGLGPEDSRRPFDPAEKSVKLASFSPDGELLALGLGSRIPKGFGGTLLVSSPLEKPVASQLPEGNAVTNALVWRSDSKRLFVGGSGIRPGDHPAFGYDLSGPTPEIVFRPHKGAAHYMTTFALRLAGEDLIQGQKDTFVVRYAGAANTDLQNRPRPDYFDTGRGEGASARHAHSAQVVAVLADPSGDWVYSVSGKFSARVSANDEGANEISVWRRVEKGAPEERFVFHGGPYLYPWAARRAVLSPDGRRLILVTVEGELRCYDAWLLRQ